MRGDNFHSVIKRQLFSAHLKRLPFTLVMMISVLVLVRSAVGLEIVLTDVGYTPMTTEAYNLFRRAADEWEARLSDPVTVNINIAFEIPTGSSALATARSARTTHYYTVVLPHLVADADNTEERAAVNSLPFRPYIRIIDFDGTRRTLMITMTTANAKALGLGTGLDEEYANPPVGVDAEIKVNALYVNQFDYDPDDGIDRDKQDFVGIITHEMGPALGFVSVTEAQDYNHNFTLYPHTLDLWRLDSTVDPHNLSTEARLVTAGPAHYYDSVLNKVSFSYGTLYNDPGCDTADGGCEASHWRDYLDNLMDPTVPYGQLLTIKDDDLHALDYIGWNPELPIFSDSMSCVIGWFSLSQWADVPHFGEPFDGFPLLPPADIISVPAKATLALRAGFDLGYEGGHNRSGLGYARFEPNKPIEPNVIQSPPPVEGQEHLDPPCPPATEIPANLSIVFIQSDLEGVPFTFKSNCGKNGCPLDPTLGPNGGYRIPGFVDGFGDHQLGDVDAIMTMILLADQSGRPMPMQNNIFYTSNDILDNNIIIYDPEAIGAILPPRCGDRNHIRPRADLDGNCIVNMYDLKLFAQEWLLCTAPQCP